MSDTAPYIDIHTHRHAPAPGVVSVFSLGLEQLALHPALPRYCSVGRHPWNAGDVWTEEQAHALDVALGDSYNFV